MLLRRSWTGWSVSLGVLLSLPGIAACRAQTISPPLLPAGVAYDAAGNLFVADIHKNQVFEVTLAGVTSVVAGSGTQGFGGDGSTATLALLNGPSSVAIAPDGSLFIADTGNQRIRAVTAGVIRTVAGNGTKGFSGDGGDALLAMLNKPVALAIDGSGGVLIADSGNHRLRRLFAGTLTTVAGTGAQGFSGEGASALTAQMDTPAGVAVASDGRIFIADSHNHRIRVIGTDGRISTFAGSGARGFGGDGDLATGASLFLPRGVAVTPAGEILFADSDNQRLRLVDKLGIITTVAGSGVQGNSGEGEGGRTSPLDSPRGVAVSSFAAPVFADAHNRTVREVAPDAALYALLGGPSHPAVVTLVLPTVLTYGQGAVGISVGGSAPVAQGSVTLLEGTTSLRVATLTNAMASLPVDALPAGLHTLTATFAGDGLHPAAKSVAAGVSVAPLTITATAQAATMSYGSFIPALSGTLSGVLPRDAATVAASFSSNAPDLSPVGMYPIVASLSGAASSNYAVVLGGASGQLQITQSPAVVAVTTPQIAYAGLPLTLSASVGPLTRGTPTGAVNFVDSGTLVGTANIAGGVATAVYLNPVSGAHSIVAAYVGDRNFLATTSVSSPVTVGATPDFSLVVKGSGTQTVQGGAIATYSLEIAAQPAPFSGSVTFSASGLPRGATLSFSPVNVVPGNGAASVTMNIQTIALAMRAINSGITVAGLALLGLFVPWAFRRRVIRRFREATFVGLATVALVCLAGCGDRTIPNSARPAQTFPVTVTATSTNLLGAVVTHSASVVLVVQ